MSRVRRSDPHDRFTENLRHARFMAGLTGVRPFSAWARPTGSRRFCGNRPLSEFRFELNETPCHWNLFVASLATNASLDAPPHAEEYSIWAGTSSLWSLGGPCAKGRASKLQHGLAKHRGFNGYAWLTLSSCSHEQRIRKNCETRSPMGVG